MEERTQSHYESLTRAIRFTRSADRKAAPVLALQIALAGTLAARFDKLQPILVSEGCDNEKIALMVIIGLYVVFTVVVLAAAACVYIPMNPVSGRSLIYFEDIASMDRAKFVCEAKKMCNAEIEDQLLDQIHRVSEIASAKMHKVRWAFILSVPSGTIWLALMIWSNVHSPSI